MMADKKKKTKLQLLLEWVKRPMVDKMLDDGESPNKVAEWINENGMTISTPTVYNYHKKRKEAIMKDVKLEQLIDKRKANGDNLRKAKGKKKGARKKALESKKPKDNSIQSRIIEENKEMKRTMDNETRKQHNGTVSKIKSELELLDAVIQLGMNTVSKMEVISPDMALKAMKLKHDITGGEHNAITTYGVEELRLREAALETALTAVLLKYVPEDKQESCLEEMEKEMINYYDSVGMKDQYMEALELELGEETQG